MFIYKLTCILVKVYLYLFVFRDIVIGDFIDEYANLPYKTFLSFEFFIKPGFDFGAIVIELGVTWRRSRGFFGY